jgi:hypothetical protein
MKPVVVLMCTVLLIFWYKTTNIQYEQTEIEETDYPFEMAKVTFLNIFVSNVDALLV